MMPTNRRRKSNSKFVDVNEESLIIKQVPFDVLKCHGSDSNRVDYHGSDSSLNSMTDDVKNLSLKEKQGHEFTGKSVLPITPVVGLELPKVELSYFDGQARGYWKFIRQFETYVASRVTDDSQRLLYLIHYCKGKAKAAIEGCVMMEASSGYKRAREILKRLFGQSHVIARETLEDLFNAVNFDYTDPEELSNLAIKMENCAMVLEQMNYTSDLNSLVTLERIVRLLPQPMQAQWADWVDKLTEDDREPTFHELTQFIASRARVACSRFGRLANRSRKRPNVKTNCHVQSEQGNSSTAKTKCSMCSYDHAIYKCPQFLALTVQERWSHAKSKGICFVCLRQGHKVNECKMSRLCNVDSCEKKHHALLHTNTASNDVNKSETQNCCGFTKSLSSQVCLGMIPVRLVAGNAEMVGYALLDNGSDVTLIKSSCLRHLGLKEDRASVVVGTVSGNRTMTATRTPFEVYSLDRSEHVTIEGALIAASVPGHKPTRSAVNNLVKWPHLRDVPIDHLDSEEVLLLIGCDVPEAHWVLDQRLGGRKNPYAVKTLLGWTVFGPASYPEYRKRIVNHTSKIQTLENEIRKFYDSEFSDAYSNNKSLSVDDKTAIRIVEGGTRFLNGHFGVPIPWKVHPNMGGGNYEVANSRLQSLKRRLLKDDILYIKYTNDIERPLTMKGILFIVSSLFDPLGLIAPVCLPAKVLLQKLCKSQIGWDQPLNEPYKSAWPNWVKFMRQIGHVTVARGIKKRIDEPDAEVELHLFSDASEIGYGAVAYARVSYLKERPYCILLYSKSRVAPIKQVTIPRLEMAAAVLSVRLSEVLQRSLPNFFCKVNFYTDSTVVLYYIRNIENRYSTYIANRLAVVHQYTKIEQWSYVKLSQNPADWTSRGIQKMSDLEFWFKCPTLLQDDFCMKITDCPELMPDNIEFRKMAVVNLNSIKSNMSPILSYYSEWLKLVRAVAWFRRFIDFLIVLRSPSHEGSIHLGGLKVKELDIAKRKILLMVQKEVYGEILNGFKNSGKVFSHNDLKGLSPIMLDGLLCVGGRLSYSDVPNAFKHPIILPSRHLVTEMIVRHYHKEQGHTGTSQVLAMIRKRYWIIKGTSTVKRVIGKCVTCRRFTMNTGQQLMAPLPACRFQPGWYSFSVVGVDYFGPLVVKRGRSLEKRYGCIFTCLQTRAVHIELTHSLNTDSFIMALLRFIGRRGKPAEIYSDNESNFVGAVSELRKFVQQLNQQKIDKELSARQIQRHFNPPSSSHRGGVWERMIRSVRRLLLLITREQTLTDEALGTYLIEIERILNDRPLTAVVQDANDKLALSPNSLLLLRECDGIVEEGSIRDKYDKRWKQVNHLANVFWKRWLREYLPSLQKRQKWLVEHRNFQKGDVVIVASDISTRGKWPLGVVEDCEIDDDGRVRTVVVRTNGGLVRRDIVDYVSLKGRINFSHVNVSRSNRRTAVSPTRSSSVICYIMNHDHRHQGSLCDMEGFWGPV
ncbi:unnamed protein product [Schistosoma margrebowiei]|uniref:Integrase catalytic domain-containing protein n=1 Tax=Schistosoma margrebowiei TaxID=48269 RepID=A0AA85A345_9TREM|nr:unnamed protein product [Schistosoma margrebowiei]CAH8641990.1 unnamed protein product [Schistosoma margrebowiei]